MSDENLIPPERGKYDHGVQDLQPRQTRNLPCFHCGDMISAREGQHTTMCNGKPYHNRCFRCHHGCKRSLVGIPYLLHEAIPFCVSCKNKLSSKSVSTN